MIATIPLPRGIKVLVHVGSQSGAHRTGRFGTVTQRGVRVIWGPRFSVITINRRAI